jgi:hypothetical protein
MRTLGVAATAIGLTACGVPEGNNAAKDNSATVAARPRVDVARLIDADKPTVAGILGQPTSCRNESRGESCAYGQETEAGKATELFFIGGRVANLTLPGYGLPFSASSLEAYGIPNTGDPHFTSPTVTRWHMDINLMPVEVNMFPDGNGGITFLYVMKRR